MEREFKESPAFKWLKNLRKKQHSSESTLSSATGSNAGHHSPRVPGSRQAVKRKCADSPTQEEGSHRDASKWGGGRFSAIPVFVPPLCPTPISQAPGVWAKGWARKSLRCLLLSWLFRERKENLSFAKVRHTKLLSWPLPPQPPSKCSVFYFEHRG